MSMPDASSSSPAASRHCLSCVTSDESRRRATVYGLEPALCQHEQPSVQCLLRLNRDLVNIFDDPAWGVRRARREQHHQRPRRHRGSRQHAVRRRLLPFVLKCLPDYPARPPLVRFMTTDAGRVRFSPNLYSSGLVSLSILARFLDPPGLRT
ncbi:ubiquitin-conjugating enzyme E2 Z-like [Rhipicephalus sanguineus]|uniref:ubiquitin-conjugating enzyme E2 Z-like n=1 Tax=Rhipicephalus sanguineus TaxID=34632 RepID=UPI001893A24F|nr:ubiquitin-conjugating enzyme E2 Z-like [Rhipicephalus sanguineus]